MTSAIRGEVIALLASAMLSCQPRAPILRFTLGLAVYFATLYVGVLIATALRPELSEQDPNFMYLVLVFPGGILHFILLPLLVRVANHPRWWPSLLLAGLSAAMFVVFWYAYSF